MKREKWEQIKSNKTRVKITGRNRNYEQKSKGKHTKIMESIKQLCR